MERCQSFVIEGRLPGYNDLKGDRWGKVKQPAMDTVMWAAKLQRLRPILGPCEVSILCMEPNTRRDRDNVTSGACKVVLDALQQLGLLRGDGQKYVTGVHTAVEVDRVKPRVVVQIKEDDNGN